MDLQAYYRGSRSSGPRFAAKSLPVMPAPFDPFNPLVLQQLSMEGPVGAIDVSKISVKAIIPGKAFVLLGNELLICSSVTGSGGAREQD